MSAGLVLAQTGEMRGTVKDSSGAAVPHAKVEITNVATRAVRAADCNDQGLYTVAAMSPGDYNAKVSADGFQTLLRAGLKLEVGQSKTIDFELQVGAASQSVTVNGDSGQINVTDASVSTVVDRNFVANLPLNGRSFNALLELTPGVVTAKATYNSQGQFSVNGQRSSSNYFTLDGVSANTGITVGAGLNQTSAGTVASTNVLGGMNALVSIDAIQEFRVQTSTVAPEYGRTPGAQISIVTRSGTNQFHGDVFDYFRNDKLDANNWFANQSGSVRPALRQNFFGGVLGGPVILPHYNGRNRTFFFVSYEGLRLRQPQTTAVGNSVPSLAARQAAPPALQPYLNAFPLPNGANLANGFAQFNATYSNPGSSDSTAVRVDQLMGRTVLFGRFAYAPSSELSRGSSSGPLNEITALKLENWMVTTGATTTIAGTMTNEARFNWTSAEGSGRSSLDTFGGAQVLASDLLFPSYASPDTSRAGFLLTGGSGTNLGIGPNAANSQKQVNAVDTFSWAKSNHFLKVGTDIRILRPVVGEPAYTVSANFTGVGDPTKSPAQQTPGSFLSGTISTGTLFTRPATFGMQYLNISTFVQDTWRLGPRVTITYGLRWDIAPPPHGTGGQHLLALSAIDSQSTLAYEPVGTPLWETHYRDLAPRLGVAYRIRNAPDSGLVLRAGSGVFYDLTGGFVGSIPSNPPNAASRTLASGTPYPYSSSAVVPSTLPGSPPYSNAVGIDPNIKTTRVYQWNTALEEQIGKYGIVSATYVGSAGRNLERATTLFNPDKTFTSVLIDQSNSKSSFHSLQLQFRGQVGSAVQLLSSYSWSHSIDNASSDIAPGVPFSRVDPNSDRGSSDYDARQTLSAAVTMSSPHSLGRWWSPLSRNWSLDTIFQARTAFPFDIWVQRDLGYGSYVYRPDLVPGRAEYIADPNAGGGRRLDTTRSSGIPNQIGAFLIAPDLRQGDLGRNATRGFGMYQADLGLRREFSVAERLRIQLKGEMFNILNHPNFADPVGTMASLSPTGVLTLIPTFGRSTSMLGSQLGSGGVNGGLSPLYQVGGARSTQLSLKVIF